MKVPARQQIQTLHHVLEKGLVADFTAAIDGGANVGDWTSLMADNFNLVHAFEPDFRTCEILQSAVGRRENVIVHCAGLLDEPCNVRVIDPSARGKSRSYFVRRDSLGEAKCVKVDGLNLPRCGLIKLDVEGAEYPALIGAEATIRRCRPVLIVEIDHHGDRFDRGADQTLGLIASFGYRKVFESRPDQVFVPE